ncbi:hypothetical protein SARC_03272 [Sphaeroforma arctica JP610]|uniref:Kinetochore protein SPC25 n=1 Tax=Sphaeroforma arctica JP610 TaxID=667725 RepID=A0A0L0G8C8_9EUKA|nr:hypothetical protein SARC_03272 [Sphaeroforma arctica JP610]KNC84498.1 hypothetical protein SARC_03272 [Sphaeroforma arctica JP610]|eukprot:XP_014158400.1 hypothetical protein SARC_03272 [Sphaeroforma arctica JP610]
MNSGYNNENRPVYLTPSRGNHGDTKRRLTERVNVQADAIAQHMYDVKAARGRFDVWVQQQGTSIQRCAADHRDKLAQQEDHVSDAQIALARIQRQKEDNARKTKQREAHVAQMKAEQKELINRKTQYEGMQSELEREIDAGQHALDEKRQVCLLPKRRETSLDMYDHAISKYKQWMGLSIRKDVGDGRHRGILVTFTLIDHHDPDRGFNAHLLINDKNQFLAGSSEPRIDLQAAVDVMNETSM